MGRGTSQSLAGGGIPGFNGWQNAVAKIVAGKTHIGVAVVNHPAEVPFPRISENSFPPGFQQRTQQPDPPNGLRWFDGRHRRRAAYARAAQQSEKYCFCLVVTVMPKNEPVAPDAEKRVMAGYARGFLQSARIVAGDFHPENMQGDIAPLAEPNTEILPFVSRRIQAVMDMCGFERVIETRTQGSERIKQHNRIDPPRKRAAQAMAGTNIRFGQYCGCRIQHRRHGWQSPGAHGSRQPAP